MLPPTESCAPLDLSNTHAIRVGVTKGRFAGLSQDGPGRDRTCDLGIKSAGPRFRRDSASVGIGCKSVSSDPHREQRVSAGFGGSCYRFADTLEATGPAHRRCTVGGHESRPGPLPKPRGSAIRARVKPLSGDRLGRELPVDTLRGQRDRFHARLDASRGEHAPVERRFRRAEAVFDELGLVFDLAVVRLEHAEWLAHQGRADEAGALLSAARQTFEALEAMPWLERLQARRTLGAERLRPPARRQQPHQREGPPGGPSREGHLRSEAFPNLRKQDSRSLVFAHCARSSTSGRS